VLSVEKFDKDFEKWARERVKGRSFTFTSTGIDIFGDAVVLRLECPEWTRLALKWGEEADRRGLDPQRFPGGPKCHVTVGKTVDGKWPQGVPDPHIEFATGTFNINRNSKTADADPSYITDHFIPRVGEAYHYTHRGNIPRIRQRGIIPWNTPVADAPGSIWQGDSLEPRPGHTYLTTHTWSDDPTKSSYVKVDLSQLDPRRFTADEDSLVTSESEEGEGINSVYPRGAWAQEWENNRPEVIQKALEPPYKTFAYRGSIPPEAITEVAEQEPCQSCQKGVDVSHLPYDHDQALYCDDCASRQPHMGAWHDDLPEVPERTEDWGFQPPRSDPQKACRDCGATGSMVFVPENGPGYQPGNGWRCTNCHSPMQYEPEADQAKPVDPWMDNEPGALKYPSRWGSVHSPDGHEEALSSAADQTQVSQVWSAAAQPGVQGGMDLTDSPGLSMDNSEVRKVQDGDQGRSIEDELVQWAQSFPGASAEPPSPHHTDAEQMQPTMSEPASVGHFIDAPSYPYKPYDWAEQEGLDAFAAIQTPLEESPCQRCGEKHQEGEECTPIPQADHGFQDMEEEWYDRVHEQAGSPLEFPAQPVHWRHDHATRPSLASDQSQAREGQWEDLSEPSDPSPEDS
jgi:hypothetical protein